MRVNIDFHNHVHSNFWYLCPQNDPVLKWAHFHVIFFCLVDVNKTLCINHSRQSKGRKKTLGVLLRFPFNTYLLIFFVLRRREPYPCFPSRLTIPFFKLKVKSAVKSKDETKLDYPCKGYLTSTFDFDVLAHHNSQVALRTFCYYGRFSNSGLSERNLKRS